MFCSFGVMLVSFVFALCVGCASKAEKESKHLERARKYVENSEFIGAEEARSILKEIKTFASAG